jgi:16S rRNA processing protein RimM
MRPNGVFAKLAGCDDRASAEALTHREIAVERRELPELGDDEIYWADLLGYQVVNLQDEVLGHVDGLIETPANDVMVVRQHDGAERLLPAVEAVVIEVDAEARQVRVDWGRDY